jgi:hypothetical protein
MEITKLTENGKDFVKKFSVSHHWPVLLTAAAEQFQLLNWIHRIHRPFKRKMNVERFDQVERCVDYPDSRSPRQWDARFTASCPSDSPRATAPVSCHFSSSLDDEIPKKS